MCLTIKNYCNDQLIIYMVIHVINKFSNRMEFCTIFKVLIFHWLLYIDRGLCIFLDLFHSIQNGDWQTKRTQYLESATSHDDSVLIILSPIYVTKYASSSYNYMSYAKIHFLVTLMMKFSKNSVYISFEHKKCRHSAKGWKTLWKL